MWNYIWPIVTVVSANIFYNVITKSTPSGANAFLSLTITYIVAAICSFVLFSFRREHRSLAEEFSLLNWTALALGLCIVALEFGYICVYRAGWKINTGSLVANICLACALVLVGLLLYKESISLRQIFGLLLCIAGLVLVSG